MVDFRGQHPSSAEFTAESIDKADRESKVNNIIDAIKEEGLFDQPFQEIYGLANLDDEPNYVYETGLETKASNSPSKPKRLKVVDTDVLTKKIV